MDEYKRVIELSLLLTTIYELVEKQKKALQIPEEDRKGKYRNAIKILEDDLTTTAHTFVESYVWLSMAVPHDMYDIALGAVDRMRKSGEYVTEKLMIKDLMMAGDWDNAICRLERLRKKALVLIQGFGGAEEWRDINDD